MSVMSGMENESIGNNAERHPKLEYGRHVLKVTKVLLKELFAGGHSYIVQFEVLESSNAACTVGETRAWQQNMTKQPKWAKQAVGAFVAAVYGYELPKDKARFESETKPKLTAIAEGSYGEAQPFVGQTIRAGVSFDSDDGVNEGFPKTVFYPMTTPITSIPVAMPPAGYRPYVKGGSAQAPAAAPQWQPPPAAPQGYAPPAANFQPPPMPAGYGPPPAPAAAPAAAPQYGYPPPPPLPGR